MIIPIQAILLCSAGWSEANAPENGYVGPAIGSRDQVALTPVFSRFRCASDTLGPAAFREGQLGERCG